MNGACDQLITGYAFARDEYRGSARRRLDDEVENLLHPRTSSDDPGKLLILRLKVLSQGRVLGHQLTTLDGVTNDDEHFIVLERLGDVVEGAALHGRDRRLDRRECRDHQH